jgi:hypothetical protein
MYSEELVNKLNQKIAALEEEIKLYKMPDDELGALIDPKVFAARLTSLGWLFIEEKRPYIVTMQITKNDAYYTDKLFQATIPFSTRLGDYCWAMVYAAKELAKFLELESKQVLVELVLASFANQNKQVEQ